MWVGFVVLGMPREHGEGGRYTETITHEAVLGVFAAVEGPVITSSDVTEVVGCSSPTARRKLDELAEQGRVTNRKTAGRKVWWRTGDDHEGSQPPERRLQLLSQELAEPIVVGDTVYEDGDQHPLSASASQPDGTEGESDE
jgi:predicted ArsR family transcriptional regulator